MNVASAYPNSDLSALTLTIMAVVMAATLAAWLILVFLADRQSRGRRSRGQADEAGTEARPAGQLTVADNVHSELKAGSPAERHGTAA